MIDVLLILSCVFLAAAVSIAVEYYRHLAKIKKEYEQVKSSFNDMILSFSRELKRSMENIQTVSYKVEVASSKSNEALKAIKEFEARLQVLEDKTGALDQNKEQMFAQLSTVEKQMLGFTESQKEILAKISLLEEKTKKVTVIPESGVEAAIPIKREKALAQLTETELAVLEMLAIEGSKTAPEIKARIGLSREHTARLMKKLYEDGYLDRDASKIPFKYNVKKEMEKLLRKVESRTA